MARSDAVALQRMAKHGYTGSKDRTDNCKGCHHSSPYVHGRKGTLKCRHLGLFVSTGAKCTGWVAKGTDLGLRLVPQQSQKCMGTNCTATAGLPHSPECRAEHDALTADIYAGRYKPMKDAPRDGTAILALLDGSDIPMPIRWREATDSMAKHGAGWYVTWDNYALQPQDGPRGWLPIPSEWLPETRPAPVENDCEDQGMSNVNEGCSKWPCSKEPLVKTDIGWKCTKCGGDY